MSARFEIVDASLAIHTPTVTVEAAKRESARAILNKLADRAEKYGQVITWLERPFVQTRARKRWDGKTIMVEQQMVDFIVDGGAPRIGNYRLLAALEKLPNGVVVRSVVDRDFGALATKWGGGCDHCHSDRARKYGYIVENEDGVKVIGKSCLRDYLGTDVPEAMLAVLNKVAEIGSMGDEDYEFGSAGKTTYYLLDVVATALASVSLFGYAKSSQDSTSTKEYTRHIVGGFVLRQDNHIALKKEMDKRADHYHALAENVIAFIRALNPKSDFENNMSVIFAHDYVEEHMLGFAVASVPMYEREQQRKKNILQSTGHWGEIKKRSTVNATVERVIRVDNAYGQYRVFLFRTDEGHVLRWKTGFEVDASFEDRPLNSGDRVSLTCTPQRHGEYEGLPQTSVNRCKFAKID